MKKLTKDSEFPNRLRALIIDRLNITQAAFCKKHGITTGYLSMILSGKRGPSADLIAEIYINYSEHLDWLLTGKEKGPQQQLVANESEAHQVIVEHQDLIKGFDDPFLGKTLNEKLIDIQDTDKGLFKSAVQSIDTIWDTANVIKAAKGQVGIPPTPENMKSGRPKIEQGHQEEGDARKDGTNDK